MLLLVFVMIFHWLFPGLLLGTEATVEMPIGAEFRFRTFFMLLYCLRNEK